MVHYLHSVSGIWTLIRKIGSLFLGSFVIKNMSFKKYIINTKTHIMWHCKILPVCNMLYSIYGLGGKYVMKYILYLVRIGQLG